VILRRPLLGTGAALALALAAVIPAPAQQAADSAAAHDGIPPQLIVGELLRYQVVLAGVRVGEASMQIIGKDTVRGHDVFHSVFYVRGGIPFFKVNDELESWFDPHLMISYRFIQRINEGGYHRVRPYDIYPDRKIAQMEGKPEEASVADPLDDGAFFYFVRTVPLKVGETYTFQRYFKLDKNPVIVKVLRLDTVTVKAGRFPCIVIQPIIKSGGIFAEGGEALMWLSDDDRRMLVQMKTKVPILKSLDLYLKSVTMAPPGVDSAASAK
jgi:hypothetical protein